MKPCSSSKFKDWRSSWCIRRDIQSIPKENMWFFFLAELRCVRDVKRTNCFIICGERAIIMMLHTSSYQGFGIIARSLPCCESWPNERVLEIYNWRPWKRTKVVASHEIIRKIYAECSFTERISATVCFSSVHRTSQNEFVSMLVVYGGVRVMFTHVSFVCVEQSPTQTPNPLRSVTSLQRQCCTGTVADCTERQNWIGKRQLAKSISYLRVRNWGSDTKSTAVSTIDKISNHHKHANRGWSSNESMHLGSIFCLRRLIVADWTAS